MRFGFWAAEEIGLLGSRRYLTELSRAERQRIAACLNLDMVASPYGELEVYDAARSIETALRRRLPRGTGEVELEGNSDHASFESFGIPVGGIFTGIDDCSTSAATRCATSTSSCSPSPPARTEAALLELSSG